LEVVINIEANLNGVKNEIAQAAQVSGRKVTDIELIAVSKTHPTEIVREAVDAGHLVFGGGIALTEKGWRLPHLLPSMKDLTLDQAIDAVARTFGAS